MSRARRYLTSLGSNSILLGVNAVYTLVSIPIALRYLTKEEFGLWIVISQVSGYLSMIDLGTSGAGIRLLVDRKDTPEDGNYGSLIKAILLAQLLQAFAILAIGIGLVPVLAGWLRIRGPLVDTFNVLWIWQVGLLGFNFVTRITVQLLSAHQRLDIVNYSQIAALLVNFGAMLLFFTFSFGVYSFALGQTFATIVIVAWTARATFRLGLFPRRWAAVTRGDWRSLFGFGSEIFLVALGTQFINSSQSFLLTRLQGLETASVWSVMTKLFTLLTQLVWRMIGVALPAFSEMFVRGEHERLWARYRSVFQMSVLASCFFGVLIGFGNSAFIETWTKGRMHWEPVNDWLLAIWFVLLTQVYCHNSLIINTKRLGALKLVYLIEGAAFVMASLVVLPVGGIPGMLLCSIACTLLFTFSYGTWRVGNLLGPAEWKTVMKWLAPAGRFTTIVLPLGVLLALATGQSAVLRLAGCVVPLALFGGIMALRHYVPRELAAEFISHLPNWSQRTARAVITGRS